MMNKIKGIDLATNPLAELRGGIGGGHAPIGKEV